MENNIIKYEGGIIKRIGNQIKVTNKLLNIDFRELHIVHFDDHKIFLRGVELSLESKFPNLHLASFTDGIEALNYIENCYSRNERLDIILSGIKQPVIDGFEFAQVLRIIEKRFDKSVPIIIISMLFDPQNPWKIFNEALKSGLFNVVLPKSTTPNEIQEKIEYFLKNPNSISSYDFTWYMSKINGIETKLLRLLYRSFSAQEIVQKMNLSFKTIEGIKSRMMEKLGVKDVNDLITYAENNCLFD